MTWACYWKHTHGQVKPSLLHGDLWSGNLSTVKSGSWAILDPATYYGHHEAEFGMSWCGGFNSAFWDGYNSVIPRAPGERNSHISSMLFNERHAFTLFASAPAPFMSQILKIEMSMLGCTCMTCNTLSYCRLATMLSNFTLCRKSTDLR